MAEYVRMYLNDISHNVDIVAKDPDTAASLMNNDTSHMARMAGLLAESTPTPEIVLFVNARGDVVYSTTPSNLGNIRMNDWYDSMAKKDDTYITGLYKNPVLNEYAFAVITPIKNSGNVVGRTMLVFSAENFQDALKSYNPDSRDNIVIVDGDGHVVSSNDLKMVNRNMNVSSFLPVQEVIQGKSGVVVHSDTLDSQSRISAFQPIVGSGWGAITSTPLAVAYKPLYDQMLLIAGALLLFIVAFSAFGYFASRYITDPIINLANIMRKISEGVHNMRVQIKREDEIGVLADTFNVMMNRLEEAKWRSDMYLELMGHDIKNVNQVALGYLEMADEIINSGDSIGKARESLIKKPIGALEESSNLINNVQKLQRARTESLQTGTFDLSKALAELADQYSHVPGRDIKIELTRDGEAPVRANELIKDVFSNLIWNAIKHSDPRKPLAIRLKIGDMLHDGKKYFKVDVEDNGPGIRDELKVKLFSRFKRGDTNAKGSGLGLYLVKTLVEGFHGRVWVEDSVPGDHTKGAKFVVMLPAVLR
jgi:signal transduction histidine kinase